MSNKETIGARIPKDRVEEIERYQQKHDLSRSDAVRDILDAGIENSEKRGIEQVELPWFIMLGVIVILFQVMSHPAVLLFLFLLGAGCVVSVYMHLLDRFEEEYSP